MITVHGNWEGYSRSCPCGLGEALRIKIASARYLGWHLYEDPSEMKEFLGCEIRV